MSPKSFFLGSQIALLPMDAYSRFREEDDKALNFLFDAGAVWRGKIQEGSENEEHVFIFIINIFTDGTK